MQNSKNKWLFMAVLLGGLLICSTAYAETLSQQWANAKKIFERNTQKKKPSKTVLGVFRKSTGIENALKKLDKAKTYEEATKALQDFSAKKEAYEQVLQPYAVDPESSQSYREEIAVLVGELANIESDAFQLRDRLPKKKSK